MSMGQQRYKEFINASQPPTLQPYTDTLRLRDSNDNFNTRLREYKDTLENQKLLLDNQQEEQNKLSRFVNTGLEYISQDINRLNYDKGYVMGYVDDDNIDATTTYGSSLFQPQTSTKPEIQTPSKPDPITPFKDSGQDDSMFAEDNSKLIGKPFDLLGQPSEGEEEQSPLLRPIASKKKQQSMTAYLNKTNDEGDEETISESLTTFKKPRDVSKKQSSVDEDFEALVKDERKKKKESMSDIPIPNIPITKSEFFSPSRIPKSKGGRPTKEEMELWKEWYLILKLNDDDVLSSSKRSDYVQPILAKLKEQYIDLRGNDESVLKSKDPQVVHKAIRQQSGLI